MDSQFISSQKLETRISNASKVSSTVASFDMNWFSVFRAVTCFASTLRVFSCEDWMLPRLHRINDTAKTTHARNMNGIRKSMVQCAKSPILTFTLLIILNTTPISTRTTCEMRIKY